MGSIFPFLLMIYQLTFGTGMAFTSQSKVTDKFANYISQMPKPYDYSLVITIASGSIGQFNQLLIWSFNIWS